MPDKIWFLQRLNLFEGMSHEEIEQVSRELRMRECTQKQQLFLGGDRVYLLKQGRVRLYHLLPDGQEVTTATVVPGQLFGLGSLFGGRGTATHAEALEHSWTCEAGAQDFLSMLARHPLLMARVMMAMARQMFHLEEAIEGLVARPVAARLARLLISKLDEGERIVSGVLLPKSSQEELAQHIGTARETVARTLSRWREEGLIEMRGRQIVVTNQQALCREAQLGEPERSGACSEAGSSK